MRIKFLYKQDDSQVRKGSVVRRQRWSEILEDLGHEIIEDEVVQGKAELVIALHAYKSSDLVFEFKQVNPEIPVFIAMTGTDLYMLDEAKSIRTLELSDRIIVSQEQTTELIPEEFREKVAVIHPSVEIQDQILLDKSEQYFDVLVIGHLRAVKDSMRTAIATRNLPSYSKIRVLHLGAILEPEYNLLVEEELEVNKRYKYLGELSKEEVSNHIGSSSLMVLSSKTEGLSNAICEAVALDLPVLCSRIDSTIGMFGEGYPGFFEFEDTDELRELLLRAEEDEDFLDSLLSSAFILKKKIHRESETRAWSKLLSNNF